MIKQVSKIKLTSSQLMLLKESGMNRRDFLKFMGKAAGAAAGAPLGNPLEIISKATDFSANKSENVIKFSMFFPEPIQMSTDGPGPLSAAFSNVIEGFNFLKAILGGNFAKGGEEIGGDFILSYRFNLKSGELGRFLERAKMAGLKVKHNDRSEWNTWILSDPEGSFRIYGSKAGISDSYERPSNPIYDYWKALRKWITDKNVIIDPKAEEMLEQVGFNPEIEKRKLLERSLEEKQKELQQKEREQKARQEEAEEEVRGREMDREVGHERRGVLDPIASRPVQALGPFESRLREQLLSI